MALRRWWRTRTPRERRLVVWTAAIAAMAGTGFAILATTGVLQALTGALSASAPTPTSAASAVPVDTPLHIDPDVQVADAAADDPRFEPLAAVPQAKWFSSWSEPDSVGAAVADYTAGARDAGAVGVIVLYQIPGRDCGMHAAGGLDAEGDYRRWVDGIAQGLADAGETLVIVEPDALAMLDRCEGQGDRIGLLRHATETIAATGAKVYIDAGHSNWIPAGEMADRLVSAGIESARGFALNVANFNVTEREDAYARDVIRELRLRGVTGTHYVIDTGRNGAGAQESTCNPPAARLGASPTLFEGGAVDAHLWIKNPGESDGPCVGGPTRGFWPEGALRLMGESS